MKLLRQLQRLVLCGALSLPLLGGVVAFTAEDAQAQILLRQERMRSGGISDRERQRVRESYQRSERNRQERIRTYNRYREQDRRSYERHRQMSSRSGGYNSGRSRGVTR
jgi:hypothetical protein